MKLTILVKKIYTVYANRNLKFNFDKKIFVFEIDSVLKNLKN